MTFADIDLRWRSHVQLNETLSRDNKIVFDQYTCNDIFDLLSFVIFVIQTSSGYNNLPDDWDNAKKCMILKKGSGEWIEDGCDSGSYGFICKYTSGSGNTNNTIPKKGNFARIHLSQEQSAPDIPMWGNKIFSGSGCTNSGEGMKYSAEM